MAQRVVGREAELAVGETFLDAVPSAPVALILEGEAGIGKTTVWRELVEAASHRSYRVLRCQPAASEAKLSYSGISDLLGDAADDVLPLLPAPQREALEIALLRAEPRKGAGDPRTTATALLSALHQLAREAPVVVAVDDVQWLDGSSARALEFAARRLGELPVALLLSLRTPHGPGVPLVLDRALPEDRLHRTPVGPLTLPALHRLLKKRLGFAPPRPTLIQIERAAGGNPFFALELARALPADGSRPPTGPLPVPETLRQVLEDRIAQLPAATRAALLVASALSDATVALVESATERTDARMLEAAEESGVIETEAGTVRFVHPLLSSLAYSLAPASERRRVHRRLGELVADVEQRARHLALSADGPDEEVAGALEQAGEHAALRGAPDAAAELLEQARRLTPAELVEDAGRRPVAGRCASAPRRGALPRRQLPRGDRALRGGARARRGRAAAHCSDRARPRLRVRRGGQLPGGRAACAARARADGGARRARVAGAGARGQRARRPVPRPRPRRGQARARARARGREPRGCDSAAAEHGRRDAVLLLRSARPGPRALFRPARAGDRARRGEPSAGPDRSHGLAPVLAR